MEKQINEKVTCDVKGCKNFATCCFEIKGFLKKIYLCNECQQKLHKSISKNFVSKSPKNKISSVLDEKQGVTSDKQRFL